MPITKDSIWQKLKKYLTAAEQERVKADSNLRADMQRLSMLMIRADEQGGAKALIGQTFYFERLLQLFPEAYRQHRRLEERQRQSEERLSRTFKGHLAE